MEHPEFAGCENLGLTKIERKLEAWPKKWRTLQ